MINVLPESEIFLSAQSNALNGDIATLLPHLTPDELAELDALLAEPRFTPVGSNALAFKATEPEVLLAGAAGTGKTRAWLERIHEDMQSHAGARSLIVRKTRKSLTETVLVTFERDVLGYSHPMIMGKEKRQRRQKYVYSNRSEIVLGGLDDPGGFLSSDYDFIYVPEAVEDTEADWELLKTRLRNNVLPYQQIVGDCNPSYPQHWLRQRSDRGQTRLIPAMHEDNPRWYDVTHKRWTPAGLNYLATLDGLTGVRKERFRYGRWVQAEGAVYEQFNEAVHLVPRMVIPTSWRRYRAIDFGYNNPFVCLWIAEDDDGNLYLYREIYKTKTLVEDHAKEINRLSEGETYEMTVADHDAEDRATLARYGIMTTAADKDVKAGIEAVQSMLNVGENGKPRLVFLRDSLEERDLGLDEHKLPASIVEEFPSYVWQRAADGRASKEVPVKDYDHGMDALRYLVYTLNNRPSWGAIQV